MESGHAVGKGSMKRGPQDKLASSLFPIGNVILSSALPLHKVGGPQGDVTWVMGVCANTCRGSIFISTAGPPLCTFLVA